jgi:radical SAM family uncharacterized protein
MNRPQPTTLADRIDREFLPFVTRPARYIGGEINQRKKDLAKCELTYALCFPDVYEVAMSNTGLAIIYDVLNNIEATAAERVFTPWTDAEDIMRQKQIPLFSLESKAALSSFDIIAFSITSELCYTNILNMLDLGGLEIRSKNRNQNDPIVIAGAGMANCCEPMAEFIDLLVLGEAEHAIVELTQLIKGQKKTGSTKKQILLAAARQFEWAYVPSLYEFEYDNEKVISFQALEPDLPVKFSNAIVDDFENAPVSTKPIVPFAQAVHERVSIEIMRGCPGRCRFCQASYCRRPIRYRSPEKIFDLAKTSYHATGFDTVSLLSLSTADYPHLEEIVARLHVYFNDKYVGLSMPSLRVDQQLKLLPVLLTSVRKSGITIAVEAATEKLRAVINKPLKDSDLFDAVSAAFAAGYKQLKLYFMVGFPGETLEDIPQIVRLSQELAKLRKTVDNRTANINITVSWLVPKPHTPFSWLGQKPKEYFEQAKDLILEEKRKLRAKTLQFKFHDIERSVLETALARGTRKVSDVIETAWRNGAKFDLWDECFDAAAWQKAFDEHELNPEDLAQRQFKLDEILPWQHLGGPEKDYLLKHYEQAMNQIKDEVS